MVHLRHIHPNEFTILLHQPFSCIFGQTRGLAVVFYGIGILMMPSGVDNNDITLLNLGACCFKIRCGDDFITFLGDMQDNTIAEESFNGMLARSAALWIICKGAFICVPVCITVLIR